MQNHMFYLPLPFLSEKLGCFILELECFPDTFIWTKQQKIYLWLTFFFPKRLEGGDILLVWFRSPGLSGTHPVAKACLKLMVILLPESTETTGISHHSHLWLKSLKRLFTWNRYEILTNGVSVLTYRVCDAAWGCPSRLSVTDTMWPLLLPPCIIYLSEGWKGSGGRFPILIAPPVLSGQLTVNHLFFQASLATAAFLKRTSTPHRCINSEDRQSLQRNFLNTRREM